VPPSATFIIVKSLIETFPEEVRQRNKMGQYPLHIAVQCGTSVGVVAYFIEKNPLAAAEQDNQGMTPLHLLLSLDKPSAEDDVENHVRDEYGRDVRVSIGGIFRLLLRAAPRSLIIEDDKGKNPLKCAVECDLSRSIVQEFEKETNQAVESFKKSGKVSYSKGILKQPNET
jgi:hypothetical protein